MKTATKSPLQLAHLAPAFDPSTLVEYLGVVNYATNERVLAQLKSFVANGVRPNMLVTSAGGPSGTAMSFYDTVRSVLRAEITTIGSGDVDSSGMIIFCTGTTRYVTAHTTALLHPAGRVFNNATRYTTAELAAMLAEDTAKDELYAGIVAENSRGRLTRADVLELMRSHTVLSAERMVELGLAEAVL